MVYTEVQNKEGREYYYRAKSVRKDGKVAKVRRYLGRDLPRKRLKELEAKADLILESSLNSLLSKKERENLEKVKAEYEKQPKENWRNRYENFLAQFTYNSNAIEGNTLSLQETSAVIFDNITPEGKSPREINEAMNHKKAFDYMLEYKGKIDRKFICELQRIIVTNTLEKRLEGQAGIYRKVQVFIRGASFIPPKPEKVQGEMRKLIAWYKRHENSIHPLIAVAYFHSAFESIHPFVDGNGRTGRLLMNFMLHKKGCPMIDILNKDRLNYYNCLEEARKGSLRVFVKFLYDILMSTKNSI